MINKYTRPRLNITYWCVTKEDLYKIYSFFVDRFEDENIPIELQTGSGNDKQYDNFKEFSEDVAKLIEDKESIEEIGIGHRTEDWGERKAKHIWIRINFDQPEASFHIIAEDRDGSYKDWVDGAYEEMRRIVRSFSVDLDFKKALSKKSTKNIIFDYYGTIRDEIKNEPLNKQNEKTPSEVSRWWERTPIQIIMVLGAIAGIIALILYFW